MDLRLPSSCFSSRACLLSAAAMGKCLLLVKQKLVIPRSLRRDILARLHASHQGIEHTLRRARQTVFWPGLSSDIKSTVKSCEECLKYGASLPKEPMLRDPEPQRIFEEVATDLFEIKGQHFLIIIDRFSG